MESSVLDHLGAEILGIISPVSICMLLVVLLVHSLVPHGGTPPAASIAMLVYDEQESDSFSEKFGGAMLNALVFVALVTVVTFLLVALFYFRCTKLMKGYMGFSAFMILAYMGGQVAVLLTQAFSIPIDVFTFSFVLYNFATVGVLAVFFCKTPIVFTQGYLVMISVFVAYWFTMIPEWTTWILLIAMALYDVVAVLVPGGPLNMLVELAIARDEDIPALIYEARPVTRHLNPFPNLPEASSRVGSDASATSSPQVVQRPQRWRRRPAASASGTNASGSRNSTELGVASTGQAQRNQAYTELPVSELGQEHALAPTSLTPAADNDQNVLPVSTDWRGSLSTPQPAAAAAAASENEAAALVSARAQALTSATQSTIAIDGLEAGTRGGVNIEEILNNVAAEGVGGGALSGAIKLGLGDFIFYSVLVGRAAMYDMMTVYACYLAIVAGLGATLLLLAVWRRALPALPISISLGVFFYFLTRLLLDPFVVNLSTHFVYF